MESVPSSSLLLEDFLEIFPKSALIITLQEREVLSRADSIKVCYANPSFLNIIGHDYGDEEDVHDSLTSMLKTKCVHPSMSRFIKWIDTVLQKPTSGHGLRTSFEMSEIAGEGPPAAHRRIVDIKWKAIVLQKKYVVLTGKTTGASSYFAGGPSRPSFLRMPSASSKHSIESPTITAVSPVSPSSSIDTQADMGFTTSYFTEAFTDGKVGSPKGLDPWRHSEKVSWSEMS